MPCSCSVRRICESGIINRLERPYYFGPEAKGIGLPVGVGAYRPDHRHVNCPGFSGGLVYFLPKPKDDLNELTAWLTERKGAASCALLGETGSGKTMACLELCRLLFACRTQYFRGMAHEGSLFTESRKSAINPAAGGKEDRDPPHARYLVLRVLPFEEEQIRPLGWRGLPFCAYFPPGILPRLPSGGGAGDGEGRGLGAADAQPGDV